MESYKEQAQLDILKWVNKINNPELTQYFIKKEIIDLLSPIKKAIYKDNIKLWNEDYNKYIINEKIIENLSLNIENRLSNKSFTIDHSLLNYEKYIFAYSINNEIFNSEFIKEIEQREGKWYIDFFVKKYKTNNIDDLIDKIKNEEGNDKFLKIDMGNWKTEEVITPNPDPHMSMHNDWPLPCYDH